MLAVNANRELIRERVSGNQYMPPGFDGVCKHGCEGEICWGLDAKKGARRYRVQQELVPFLLFCSLFHGLASFEDREVLFFMAGTLCSASLETRTPGPFNRSLPGKFAR